MHIQDSDLTRIFDPLSMVVCLNHYWIESRYIKYGMT